MDRETASRVLMETGRSLQQVSNDFTKLAQDRQDAEDKLTMVNLNRINRMMEMYDRTVSPTAQKAILDRVGVYFNQATGLKIDANEWRKVGRDLVKAAGMYVTTQDPQEEEAAISDYTNFLSATLPVNQQSQVEAGVNSLKGMKEAVRRGNVPSVGAMERLKAGRDLGLRVVPTQSGEWDLAATPVSEATQTSAGTFLNQLVQNYMTKYGKPPTGAAKEEMMTAARLFAEMMNEVGSRGGVAVTPGTAVQPGAQPGAKPGVGVQPSAGGTPVVPGGEVMPAGKYGGTYFDSFTEEEPEGGAVAAGGPAPSGTPGPTETPLPGEKAVFRKVEPLSEKQKTALANAMQFKQNVSNIMQDVMFLYKYRPDETGLIRGDITKLAANPRWPKYFGYLLKALTSGQPLPSTTAKSITAQSKMVGKLISQVAEGAGRLTDLDQIVGEMLVPDFSGDPATALGQYYAIMSIGKAMSDEMVASFEAQNAPQAEIDQAREIQTFMEQQETVSRNMAYVLTAPLKMPDSIIDNLVNRVYPSIKAAADAGRLKAGSSDEEMIAAVDEGARPFLRTLLALKDSAGHQVAAQRIYKGLQRKWLEERAVQQGAAE